MVDQSSDARKHGQIRRRWLILLILLGLSFVGLAGWRINTAVRLSDSFRVQPSNAQWTAFRPNGSDFSVSFPGQPEQSSQLEVFDGQAVPSSIVWSVLRDGRSYSLRTITYPATVDLSQPNLNLARTIKALLADTPGLELATVTKTSQADQLTADLAIREPAGEQRDYRFVLRNRTLVVMVAAGPAGTQPDSSRFFNALQFESDREQVVE